MKEDNWQPIETAPIWVTVIIYVPDAPRLKSCHKVFTAVQVKPGVWDLAGSRCNFTPTAWQYLPEPPTK